MLKVTDLSLGLYFGTPTSPVPFSDPTGSSVKSSDGVGVTETSGVSGSGVTVGSGSPGTGVTMGSGNASSPGVGVTEGLGVEIFSENSEILSP